MKKIERITYNKEGRIEGNLFELPRKYRLEAITQRFIWLLTNPLNWLVVLLFLIALMQFNQLNQICELVKSMGINGIGCSYG